MLVSKKCSFFILHSLSQTSFPLFLSLSSRSSFPIHSSWLYVELISDISRNSGSSHCKNSRLKNIPVFSKKEKVEAGTNRIFFSQIPTPNSEFSAGNDKRSCLSFPPANWESRDFFFLLWFPFTSTKWFAHTNSLRSDSKMPTEIFR